MSVDNSPDEHHTTNMRSCRTYLAIDLKSFYASVECRERHLDPLRTNLVVADVSRTEKTICLAVSPSLKAYGISGRARLFEVLQRVRQVNEQRLRALRATPGESQFIACSFDDRLVRADPRQELGFLAAKPRMALYLDYSVRIYQVYLKYFAPEDIHVYSIDEVLIDAGSYLRTYKMTARQLVSKVIQDILAETGITATAGIGTNLYLAKVAMDILAKHELPDEYGVRIAELDEDAYKRRLWGHKPLTDFWRIGRGYARRLQEHGMHTMGDIARCSLGAPSDALNEDVLFNLFGKNAELLIDHAWGVEPVTMEQIKAYRPQSKSIVSGQVLHCPYSFEDARLVAWEMAEQLALDLTAKQLTTNTLVLTVGYDRASLDQLQDPYGRRIETTLDGYGRKVPRPAHGTAHPQHRTASAHLISEAVLALFDEVVDPDLLVRKVTIAAERLMGPNGETGSGPAQLTLFQEDDMDIDSERAAELEREHTVQRTMLDIRQKFGKNAVLKAANLQEAATAAERNNQIGGHSA